MPINNFDGFNPNGFNPSAPDPLGSIVKNYNNNISDAEDEYEEESEIVSEDKLSLGNYDLKDDYDTIIGGEDDNSGFGTNAIIEAIRKLDNSAEHQYDIALINANTLIRNVTTKDRMIDEIENYFYRDVTDLIDAITLRMNNDRVILDNPYVILYFPIYETPQYKLHERVYKPGSTKDIINQVSESILRKDNLKVRKQVRDYVNDIDVFRMVVGDRATLPYKDLSRTITDLKVKFNPAGLQDYLRRFLMISHYPLDYYFLETHRRTNIFESFTGNIVRLPVLGQKVFNVGYVPFNRVTHLLFGDKVQLMPMAKGKRGRNNSRKVLMELAQRQEWNLRTPNEIAKLVGQSGQVPEAILRNITF